MGTRGPVSAAEATGGPIVDVKPPSWLSASQKRIFRDLISQARAARINLAGLDGEAFAVAAVYIESFRAKPDVRAGRDLIALLREIGGTPMARARLAIKPATDKKSKMAQLLKLTPKSA